MWNHIAHTQLASYFLFLNARFTNDMIQVNEQYIEGLPACSAIHLQSSLQNL